MSEGDLLQIREVQVGSRKGGVVVGVFPNGCNCMACLDHATHRRIHLFFLFFFGRLYNGDSRGDSPLMVSGKESSSIGTYQIVPRHSPPP